MKKMMIAVVAVLCMVGVWSGAHAADMKIGVVDVMRAVNESDAGKKAIAELEIFAKAKESEMGEKVRPIERLRGELEKQGTVLSRDARKAKEEELERLQRDAQRFIADAQAEMKKKQEGAFAPVLKDMRETISAVAKENGMQLIMEATAGVLYADRTIDLTDLVIRKHNTSKR